MKWVQASALGAIAGLAVLTVSAATWSTPSVEEVVYQCEVDAHPIFQGLPCDEGTLVKGWNLPAEQGVERQEGRSALVRTAERTSEPRIAREQRQQLPRLEVETRCRQVASVGGGYSANTFNACMRQEQSAYNGLASLYSRMPSPIRERCLQVATVGGGGSYSTLKACLEQERSAASSTPDFRY